MSPRVLVSIVTHNSAPYLEACIRGLKAQTFPDFAVSLWDNASEDNSLELIARHADCFLTTHFSNTNVGFCAAHNRVLGSLTTDYALVLNPDVVLDPRFIETLVQALDRDPRAGSATGKLWRLDSEAMRVLNSAATEFRDPSRLTLDSTGIYFTPNQRHFDRGAGDRDMGQYEVREYVFGPSGAAAFYRRSMLEEIRAGREYFDEAFFAYREDADLAWRAQWLGWRCLYVPEARGFHVRRVLPERRTSLPAAINMHSFKNRFLMRVKNMDAGTYCRFFIPITLRDLMALVYVLAREWTSLPGITLFFRALPGAWTVRRALRRHRRVAPAELRTWFSRKPVARPAVQ
jgi:GT2 family glycosyltransferase